MAQHAPPAEQSPPQTDQEDSSPDFTIVGIGASAGGLAALKALFSHVPADAGLAFVVVMHLSPEHESRLAELLQPGCPMPVQQVTETTEIKPNHVYIIPPNANLNTIDTHLRLSKLEADRRERAPIDHFFRTLADTHDGHSVGVILTGTGSDGTLGLRRIKERGGLTIVQDPEEAEHDGMPRSAIASGHADFQISLPEISKLIVQIAKAKLEMPVPGKTPDIWDGNHNRMLPELLDASGIATLFLDRGLRIVRFTPRVGELFNVRHADCGRPLSDLTHKLRQTNLTEDARGVLNRLAPIEREIQTEDGQWFLTRLLPYRTADDRIDGVVLTFVDVTERKRAEDLLRQSENRLRALVMAGANVVYQMSPDWSRMQRLEGRGFIPDHHEPDQPWLDKYIPDHERDRVQRAIQEAVESKETFAVEHQVIRIDGSLGWTFSRAVPLLDDGGEIVEWFGAASDITERKQAEHELQYAKEYAESIVETLHEPLLVLNPDLTVKSANPAFFQNFQVKRAETIDRKIYDLGNGQWDIPALRLLLEDVLPDSNVFNDFEVRHTFEDIGERVMLLNARRLDHVQLILLGIRDITERKKAEDARQILASVVESSQDAIISETLDGEILTWNAGAERLFGYTAEEAIGQSIRMIVPDDAWDQHRVIRDRLRQ